MSQEGVLRWPSSSTPTRSTLSCRRFSRRLSARASTAVVAGDGGHRFLGPRFMAFRAVTEPLDNSMRLTIDSLSAAREAQPAPPPQTTQAVPAPEAPDISALS